jgi:hypothetical protein
MTIQIEIPDDFFSPDERDKLISLLRLTDDAAFADAIARVTLAALDEYRQMLLGIGLPSRANEIREYRLYHLIKRYFQNQIPDELEVASMFQLPISRSKNLILNVLARFRYDLEGEILNTLRLIITDAKNIDDGREFRVYISSSNMVDELNRIIFRSGLRLRPLVSVKNEPNFYSIAPDSYDLIRKHLVKN